MYKNKISRTESRFVTTFQSNQISPYFRHFFLRGKPSKTEESGAESVNGVNIIINFARLDAIYHITS